jgi:hypothetical protein
MVIKVLAVKNSYAYISLIIAASHMIQCYINRSTLKLTTYQFPFLDMTVFLLSTRLLLVPISSHLLTYKRQSGA